MAPSLLTGIALALRTPRVERGWAGMDGVIAKME